MRLRILAVGKLKQRGLESLEADYLERARKTCPIEVASLRSMQALRERSAGRRPRVVLDERGQQITSEELAGWIGRWREDGVARVDFCIGDAHGFEDGDRADADELLALSRLTLPHRLARLLLVEQLYRAGTILAGHPYHHR